MENLSEGLKREWNRMKKRKNGGVPFLKKDSLLIVFLLGLLLLVIAFPGSSRSEKKTDTDGNVGEDRVSGGEQTSDTYCEDLENRLKNALEQMRGVGDVDVVITLSSAAEKVVEKDADKTDSGVSETTVYEDTAEGKAPYISGEKLPQIEGVLVIADGGDNAVTAADITESVEALFGIEPHKIKVVKRADQKEDAGG